MTTTTEPEPPVEDDPLQALGKQLLRTATSPGARSAVQALLDERTVLEVPAVQRALVVDTGRGQRADFDGLLGRLYTLGLDEQQRSFLGLVLSMVGIGMTTIAAVQDLDERCLPIILRAVLRLADNDTIAVGTRI
ncbi:hypothetical protein [Streptomyces sp. NPDC008137]|uniref:hypothetical protein n=1 Tax=Streptomyces sp. NPDC008137 TaxID=3364813 RepID=UPI0036E1CB54